jgi:hypothetical protein
MAASRAEHSLQSLTPSTIRNQVQSTFEAHENSYVVIRLLAHPHQAVHWMGMQAHYLYVAKNQRHSGLT